MALPPNVRGRLNSVRAWINGYTALFHGPDLENAREALERLVKESHHSPEADAAAEEIAKAIVAIAAAARQPDAVGVGAAKKAAIAAVDRLEALLSR